MRYNYVPPEELDNNLAPLPEGDYNFTIKHAEELISKNSGLPMIKLTLECCNDQLTKGIVFDYLVSGDNNRWKISQLSQSVKDPSIYQEHGEISDSMLTNQRGRVHLHIVKSPGYPDSSKVKFYICDENTNSSKEYSEEINMISEGINMIEDFDDEMPL